MVAYRDGAPVLLRDVGHAEIGPANSLPPAGIDRRRAVVLNVLREPGANAIATVDQIKAELPRLHGLAAARIKLSIVSDRTQTIRASVGDVRFTLMLTVALVVMTIFLFLRKFWATVIPGIAVPLSLIGTFAVMYVLGYSLDNLSLMGLSIAVGFVVDDAIVMIENVSRHLERECRRSRPRCGARARSASPSSRSRLSLVAVFIPLFMMGGVVGKMLQEFAVTVAVAIFVSAFVSLSLTPTLCALLLTPEPKAGGGHGRLHRLDRAGLRLARGASMTAGSSGLAAPAPDTLIVMLVHRRPDRAALYRHPQGLLSAAGYRTDRRHHRGGAGHLARRAGRAPAGGHRHPAARSRHRHGGELYRSRADHGGAEPGPHVDRAQALWRAPRSRPQVIARLDARLQQVQGIPLPAAGTGPHHRRPHGQRRSTSTRWSMSIRRSWDSGAPSWWPRSGSTGPRGGEHRPGRERPRDQDRDRPQGRRQLRLAAAGHRHRPL